MAKQPKNTERALKPVEAAWVEDARRRASSAEFRTRAMLRCFERARKYGPLIDLRDALGLTIEFATAELLKACIPEGVATKHTDARSVAKIAAVNVITSHLKLCACASDTGLAPVDPQELDRLVDQFMSWWTVEVLQAASAALNGSMTARQRRIREIRAPFVDETTPTPSELIATLKAGYRAHERAAGTKTGSDAVPEVAAVLWSCVDDPQRLAGAIHRTAEGKVTIDSLRLRDLMGGRKRKGDVREVASDDETIEASSAPKQLDPESEVVAAVEAAECVGAAREIQAWLAERAAACAPGSAEQIVVTHFLQLAVGPLSARQLAERTGLPRTTIQSVLDREKARLRGDPRFRSLAQHLG